MIKNKEISYVILAVVVFVSQILLCPLLSSQTPPIQPPGVQRSGYEFDCLTFSVTLGQIEENGVFYHAKIICHDTSIPLRQGKVIIYFPAPDSSAIWPENFTYPENVLPHGGSIVAPPEQYTWYLDALRNSKKCSAVLNFRNPKKNRLECSADNVGWGHPEN